MGDAGYFDRRDEAFVKWKTAILKADISSEIRSAAETWTKPDDLARWAKQRLVERGFAPENYTRDPAWSGWEKTYDRFNQTFLIQNPGIDALAVEWGYQSRVHSPAAARLYKQRTGLKAPIPQS